ncbi:MAG: hypothetical protein U5R46_18365 [Gammaproteobacteria bacterium]|nr:hypothetical protein [Gammaproteobacteria bacterium]
MVEIHFEVGGKKLDPCFIGDSVTKAVLLRAARQVKRKFADIRIPDSHDALRILIKGRDINNLKYELHGSPEVLDLVRQQHGHARNDLIDLAA